MPIERIGKGTSLTAAGNPGRMLRVSICEIERGLFQAKYRTHKSAVFTHELPTYQVGVSASEARQWIEQSARAIGYDTIIWEKAQLTVPRPSPTLPRPPDSRAA
jgi:hypothetical protein